MSALRYAKNENRHFHTFVANRIAVIRDGSNPDQWYHVEGTINPGDHTSRGLSADALLNCERRLLGPEFLWNPEHHWIKELGASIAIQDEDQEVRPNPVVEFNKRLSAAAAVVVLQILSDYFQRFLLVLLEEVICLDLALLKQSPDGG